SDECEIAFNELKKKLSSYPVLRLPDVNKTFFLTKDATGYCIGVVLSQKDDKGSTLANADALSRPAIDYLVTVECTEEDEIVISSVSIKEVNQDVWEDANLLHYIQFNKIIAGLSKKEVNKIKNVAKNYKFDNSKLLCLKNDVELEVPKPEDGKIIIEKVHNFGHFGEDSTLHRIKESNTWPYMLALINQCVTCQRNGKASEIIPNIRFVKGIPDIDEFDQEKNNLIILDDLMKECEEDCSIQKLFTIDSHHRNISVFFVTQNIFSKGKFTRTLNLNSNYLILFNNPRVRLQTLMLARQMFPNKVSFFMENFEDASSKPHGYIFIDLNQSTENRNRIQTGITPDETRIIYTLK
ncbi:unnamed protein product, partial [Brachionus calyciflorus]